ncbi:hypothetical protein HMPREF1008_00006 [Olsenella sp. oral taxon 809 str. F0356]|nr:hypothetical protein HMPREF1008_00006 [Olsenella sp. oral taxon 809 str. F0356]
MRAEIRWRFLRASILLARVLPCTMTSRMRSAYVSNSLRCMWH